MIDGQLALNGNPDLKDFERSIESYRRDRRLGIVILLILIIGTFYLLTIRSGQPWGDDFALYIQEAADIAHHSSYMKSNYLFNPQNPGVGPKAYPPVYPLLLSPIYAVFDLNLTAMKVENVVLFIAFLAIFYFFIRDELPFPYVVAAIAIVGVNPNFWYIKDGIQSEVPFTLFLFTAFFAIKRAYEKELERGWISRAVLLAVLIYLCYGTRTTGILLIPALLGYEVVRFRRITRLGVTITGIFVVLWLVQNAFGSSDASYVSTLPKIWTNPKIILQNTVEYTRALSLFWASETDKPIRYIVFLLLSSLAAIGYLRKLRRPAVWDLYLPLHLSLILVLPYPAGLRYLLPIAPLYVLYALTGFREFTWKGFAVRQAVVFPIVILLVALSYTVLYRRMDFGAFPDGIAKKETVAFFQYVRNNTEPTAVFIFRKPKALGLFGQRLTSVYPAEGTDGQLWQYIESIHATYLVKYPIDDPLWHTFLNRNRDRLIETYSNADFKVYKVPKDNIQGQPNLLQTALH